MEAGLFLVVFSMALMSWGFYAKHYIVPVVGLLVLWAAFLKIFVPHFWR